MHFSVPDTQELYAEASGTTYTGYNIYINGSYHCCLRYKQLHGLHEQLRRHCITQNADIQLPAFPPKRLLPLTPNQLETRRIALEHYLQLVGQESRIAKLDYFQNFLLSAQHETAVAEGLLEECGVDVARPVSVEVLLMNGYQLQISYRVRENSNALLQKVCQSLQLPMDLTVYFCLYLVRRQSQPEGGMVLVRRLLDFESPFLSRLRAPQTCQVLLRTGYWNITYDLQLLQHAVTLNLLYIQTIGDVEGEWLIATPEMRQKLRGLQQHGLKKEYIEMARQLPLYGCLQFAPAIVDYPEPQTNVLISIGNKELSMRTAKGSKIYETKFRVTRMRCWRVTALHDTALEAKDTPSNLQLAFEYLMSKQSLRWINISSPQAMLMSVCLQGMVDELLNHKETTQVVTPTTHAPLRNGQNLRSNALSSSSSTPSLSNDPTVCTSTSGSSSNSDSTCSSTSSPTTAHTVHFLSKCTATKHNSKISNNSAYSAVFFRNAQQESVQNGAFEAFIGDDDL